MPYKKLNHWFLIYPIFVSGLIALAWGLIGSIGYGQSYGQMQMIPPSIWNTEYAWSLVPLVIGEFVSMIAGGLIYFLRPTLHIECLTEQEQENLENEYLTLMKEKGFHFDEDKDVL